MVLHLDEPQVDGRLHKIQVSPGEAGRAAFMEELRRLMGYDEGVDFDVVFDVKVLGLSRLPASSA